MPWIVQKDIFWFLSISYCLTATCIANIIQDLHNILNTTMRTITCIFWHTQAFCRSLYSRGRRSWSYGSWIYYLCNQCLSPLMLWVRISIRARCTTLCDKVCQWLATGQWFSPGPAVSSTNKTDRYNIAEILLKVALNTIKQTNKLKMFLLPEHESKIRDEFDPVIFWLNVLFLLLM